MVYCFICWFIVYNSGLHYDLLDDD